MVSDGTKLSKKYYRALLAKTMKISSQDAPAPNST